MERTRAYCADSKKQVMGQLFTRIGANEPSIQGLNVSQYYDYDDRPPRSPRREGLLSVKVRTSSRAPRARPPSRRAMKVFPVGSSGTASLTLISRFALMYVPSSSSARLATSPSIPLSSVGAPLDFGVIHHRARRHADLIARLEFRRGGARRGGADRGGAAARGAERRRDGADCWERFAVSSGEEGMRAGVGSGRGEREGPHRRGGCLRNSRASPRRSFVRVTKSFATTRVPTQRAVADGSARVGGGGRTGEADACEARADIRVRRACEASGAGECGRAGGCEDSWRGDRGDS